MEDRKKVYVETSVVSYYTGKTSRDIVIAGHQVSTKDFWDKLVSKELIPVISALVIKEAIEKSGYICPIIISPEELLGGEL
jgi:hypothetical protein